MSTRSTRSLLAGVAVGLLGSGLAATAPAATAAADDAARDASRLPTLGEVAELYPYLERDGRRVVQDGPRQGAVVSPNPVDVVEGGGDGCTFDGVSGRAESGRRATYAGDPSSAYASPSVLAQRFDSDADAREAFGRLARRVRVCEGTWEGRDETSRVTRREVATPRFGEARIGYRELHEGDARLRVVVLRGDLLLSTERRRRGADVQVPQRPLEKLTWLALRTL
ncbi:hypothetical protein [uncultured Nocardioides sp.]|uniref:hypothetical protein n=1 Tax=uncultured Nocardioides sp. TaxID=198441 RepID=UPI00261ACB09|nr:hypothetical protein [uncultured Nocardioides sp.]